MTEYALVTGSTSGIGKAFAEKLAAEHHNLILVSRNESLLMSQSHALMAEYGVEVRTITTDLAEPGAAGFVYARVEQHGLQVGILVNNAGFNECGDFLDTDMTNEAAMIQLHTACTTEMMKHFVPAMVKRGHGRVLNVGSTGSYMACPGDAVYAATKAYILQLSKAIHTELKGTGVTVTTLCPGSTKTAFAAKAGMEDTLLFKLFVMQPERVAEIGYSSMMKGRATVTAGIYNKLLVLASKITPASILNPLTRKMLST